jgi:class 3 adenylate cyclase
MRCARCGSDNPDGAKFCIECAEPLQRRCPNCTVENSPRAKFCAECGTSLAGNQKAGGTGQHARETDVPREGERRQLTVMFCDLVGSNALSEQLDPEEWRTVVRDYQTTSAAVIRRFEGHVAQYLGDGLLVYFGYPQAHEDDAQRAVQAGLEIITGRDARSVQIRIGIHTGLVVVGRDRGQQQARAAGPGGDS